MQYDAKDDTPKPTSTFEGTTNASVVSSDGIPMESITPVVDIHDKVPPPPVNEEIGTDTIHATPFDDKHTSSS